MSPQCLDRSGPRSGGRRALLIAALCLSASPATAGSPYDWRAYPNGDRAIVVSLSAEWLLLSVDPKAATEPLAARVETSMLKSTPGAVLSAALRLSGDRLAVRIEGSDTSGLRWLGQDLVRAGAAFATWPAVTREDGVGFLDDQVTVAFAGPPNRAALAKAGVVELAPSALPGVYLGRALDGDGVGAAWALTREAGVRYAEPDLLRHIISNDLPDDPRLGEQWHLSGPDAIGGIDAPGAWLLTQGDAETVVAIFDTGYDMEHPDLVANIVGGFDAASNDNDPSAECSASPDGIAPARTCPSDRPYRESHGTAVAGVVAARGGNGLFGTGVCPSCGLYLVRFLGSSGVRSLSNAAAFQRASDAGVGVINNSWGPGLTRYFPLANAERETFDRITTEARDGRGVVLVFAAGNDFFTPATANPYASHPGVITVSASTRTDDFACYSNYGSVIAVAGPSRGCFDGESGIATTDYQGSEGYSAEDFTRDFGGTSAASPVVAGVAGLVLSANPGLTAQQVRLVLQRSAEKIRADKNPWQARFGVDLASEFDYDERGFSRGFGYGRVNAARAVALALEMPDAVAGVCDEACPRCVGGRCAPNCETDDDCPAATRCMEQGDGALACVLPGPLPTDPGQPCIAECETCVDTVDSRLNEARVCSRTCVDDEACPFGFDCRTLEPGAPSVCVPGNAECGAEWGSVRCQSEVRVQGSGVDFCSCDCVPGQPGACPDGFECANVTCQRQRGGILCERAANPREANYYPTCLPDPNFERPCTAHRECPGGLFCIEGTCAIDDDQRGCDICAPCTVDAECGPGSVCAVLPRGNRCVLPCEFGGRANQCPGDSVCTDLPGPPGDHCVNPDFRRKGFCPAAYRCEIEGRCFTDADCPEGIACGDNGRCFTPDEPDSEVVDAGVPDADAPSPDMLIPLDATLAPDSRVETDGALTDDEKPKGDSGGCTTSPGHPDAPLPAWLIIGGLAGLLLRRRVA